MIQLSVVLIHQHNVSFYNGGQSCNLLEKPLKKSDVVCFMWSFTAETDKTLDPIAESAAPAPLPDSSEDKPKADAMEQSPAAPVELSVEEKADDEDVVSNKTSVETLKETNENNSNNADLSQQRGRHLKFVSCKWSYTIWEFFKTNLL